MVLHLLTFSSFAHSNTLTHANNFLTILIISDPWAKTRPNKHYLLNWLKFGNCRLW